MNSSRVPRNPSPTARRRACSPGVGRPRRRDRSEDLVQSSAVVHSTSGSNCSQKPSSPRIECFPAARGLPPRSPATSPAQYPAGGVGGSVRWPCDSQYRRMADRGRTTNQKTGQPEKEDMNADAETEFQTALATARHALLQFNAEPLVASKRGGPRLSRGSAYGSRHRGCAARHRQQSRRRTRRTTSSTR